MGNYIATFLYMFHCLRDNSYFEKANGKVKTNFAFDIYGVSIYMIVYLSWVYIFIGALGTHDHPPPHGKSWIRQ